MRLKKRVFKHEHSDDMSQRNEKQKTKKSK